MDGWEVCYGSLTMVVWYSSRGIQPDSWNFRPTAAARSSTGYSGLTNLGNICYLNAIMQQLYMMPRVR